MYCEMASNRSVLVQRTQPNVYVHFDSSLAVNVSVSSARVLVHIYLPCFAVVLDCNVRVSGCACLPVSGIIGSGRLLHRGKELVPEDSL